MKTITATEAHIRITEIINSFIEIQSLYMFKPVMMNAIVENVGFVDLVILFNRLKTEKKRFFLPGEMDNENICFIYKPVEGCTILVESEPCLKDPFKKGVNLINMN